MDRRNRLRRRTSQNQENTSSSSSSSSQVPAKSTDDSKSDSTESMAPQHPLEPNTTDGNGEDEDEEEEEEEEEEAVEDYDQQIRELEATSDNVLRGIHPDFFTKNQEYELSRSRKFKTAELHRTLQCKNNTDILQFGLQKAENLYKNAVEAIQEKMLRQMQTKLRELKRELAELERSDSLAQQPSKKPRVVSVNDSSLKAYEEKLARKQKQIEQCSKDYVRLNSTKILSPEEILQDIQQIYEDWKKSAEKASARAPQTKTVSCEKGRLVVHPHVFQVGDNVVVTSTFANEVYEASISAFTKDAVLLQLEGGTRARVYFAHLIKERCLITPRTDAYSIAKLERTGWAY